MVSAEVEDYLEAIYSLSLKKGYARTKEIAKALKVKPASVSQMVRKLGRLGHVEYETYGSIELTTKGKKIAKEIRKRHDLLSKFFRFIIVPPKIADADACKIEHYLHSKTANQLMKFVEFATAEENSEWLRRFKIYCKTGKIPRCREKVK
jgi:DtxR family Mn-dependent transcriptional regulator